MTIYDLRLTIYDLRLNMLKPLKLPNKENKEGKESKDNNIDKLVASNLVDILFQHVLRSVQNDRSTVKFNLFKKAFIISGLGGTRDGTKEYINGMFTEDIKLLLNDMAKEMDKRKRQI